MRHRSICILLLLFLFLPGCISILDNVYSERSNAVFYEHSYSTYGNSDNVNNNGISDNGTTSASRASRVSRATRTNTDADGDGIADEQDAFPNDPAAANDTDNDDYPDAWNFGNNQSDSTSDPSLELDAFPGNPGAWLDTDTDGLPDELNLELNTDPSLSEDLDDDNDRMPDAWEIEYDLDPKNPEDSTSDMDADGYSNLNEYLANTDPRNNQDHPVYTPPPKIKNEDTEGFLFFLIFSIFAVMCVSIIIGMIIVEKRRRDEEFWTLTFGSENAHLEPSDSEKSKHRETFNKWQDKLESKTKINVKSKYPLEFIGGPPESTEGSQGVSRHSADILTHKRTSKQKSQPNGRLCIWCDRGITRKYIKRCPGARTSTKRCPDGPFCSQKCLNEHLNAVPHFHKVNF